jgi:hypothetical protein
MTAFWVIGIAINVVFACALIWWAVRAWRSSSGSSAPARDGSADRR